ncbi:ClpP/crotonase-like domain-containing protein [Pseudomassariella vexata]|uniref:ClpP/crotonase-like domain-containing protein n=1 Tax=Pseudomassariella vexata TaxID=1141098 RepID=A0A1Y2E3H1_9PEZI|nr:ClpP/crotonase-like domain-containing protein [Pseudomassariella vexata]ORY66100.1 ClpP/crotonase-like domain-containing protein [Pseudomassariella vexata]
MATTQTLFTIPIPPLKAHPGGTITCTLPAPQTYLLTISSPPDNRLTPPCCAALLSALDQIEFVHATSTQGVVITTSSIPKFYSNGLDLELALGTPGFVEKSLYPLFRRFLTFPMPTVALINGHCFAGGLMLAMHHDYRVFSGEKGYMCINELDFGSPLLPPMAGIFREKLRPDVYRHMVLEARRWDARAALEAGIVDSVEGIEGVMGLITERGLATKGKTGVYGLIKEEMYRGQIALLDATGKDVVNVKDLMVADLKRKKEGKAKAEKAKL